MITSLGIGILVGTSLIVIIPEGADAMYAIEKKSVGAVDELKGESSGLGSRRSIGLALIVGFLLMYLIDKIPECWSALAVKRRESNGPGIDMSNLRFTSVGGGAGGGGGRGGGGGGGDGSGVGSGDGGGDIERLAAGPSHSSTSIGLIIHAIADGVALGASVSTESSALEMIIFLAIMIHKAPASFGLTTVLMGSGVPLARVKRDLITFAAAAPVGAILTYFLISLLGSNDSELIQWWTGVLLVFSGGTFLYVAVDAMAELHDVHSPLNEYGDSSASDLVLSSIGMLIPIVTFFVPDI